MQIIIIKHNPKNIKSRPHVTSHMLDIIYVYFVDIQLIYVDLQLSYVDIYKLCYRKDAREHTVLAFQYHKVACQHK